MEDRLATLKNVIKEPELNGWNLYLGDFMILLFFLFLSCLSVFIFGLVAKLV